MIEVTQDKKKERRERPCVMLWQAATKLSVS